MAPQAHQRAGRGRALPDLPGAWRRRYCASRESFNKQLKAWKAQGLIRLAKAKVAHREPRRSRASPKAWH